VDPALKRSGRFDRIIEMKMPDHKSREALLMFYLKGTKHTITELHLKELAQNTNGFSAADIKILVHEATMLPIRKEIIRKKTLNGKYAKHEPNGHEPNGHPNGHESNGHEPNGHEPNGHETNSAVSIEHVDAALKTLKTKIKLVQEKPRKYVSL